MPPTLRSREFPEQPNKGVPFRPEKIEVATEVVEGFAPFVFWVVYVRHPLLLWLTLEL